jgi:uncharacterized protein (DUF2384 family)
MSNGDADTPYRAFQRRRQRQSLLSSSEFLRILHEYIDVITSVKAIDIVANQKITPADYPALVLKAEELKAKLLNYSND